MTKKKVKEHEPKKAAQKHEANGLAHHLSRAILLLGCFVLFLPLVVDNDFYFPYVFLKSILFRVAVQAMVLLYVILALISPEHKPRFHRITYALMAYFGVMAVCSLPGISVGAWNSWWGDFTRMGGMFTQLHLLAYFFVLTQTLKQERDWLILFTASLFFGVFMGLTGLIHLAGLDFIFRFNEQEARMGGATGNPNFFATYMLLDFFVALFLIARGNKRQIYSFVAKTWLFLLIAMDVFLVIWDVASGGRILSAGLALVPLGVFAFLLHGATLFWFALRGKTWAGDVCLGILIFYFLFWMIQSRTRATVVGLAGSLALMAILYLWKGQNKRLKWASALLILLFMAMPVTLFGNRKSGWVHNNPILHRLTRTSLQEHRFLAWKAGFAGMMDRPVLGWGLEHYRNAFDLHVPARLLSGPKAENWYDRAHNIIVDVGTTTGFLGLAAYLGFYGIVFTFLLRRWFGTREVIDPLLIAGLLAAYLVQNLFTFDTPNTDGIVFLVLAYVAYLYDKARSDAGTVQIKHPKPVAISNKGWAVLACSVVILGCGFLYLVKEPYESNLLLILGKSMEKASSPRSNASRYAFGGRILDTYQRAENYGTMGRYEVRQKLADYACVTASAGYIPLDQKSRAAKQAAAFLERSISEDPADVRHTMYLSTLVKSTFAVMKQTDPGLAVSLAEKSLSFLQKAETLSPNRPRLFLDRAQLLLLLGRNDEAIPALQKAIALDPSNRELRVELVAAHIAAGRNRDAEIEWRGVKAWGQPPTEAEYRRVAVLYAAKKQIVPLIALYKEQLQTYPDNAIILTSLATAYREVGDMESARQTALKAAALSPQIAATLDGFLKTLQKKAATE